ncbi:hypothetical protein GGX14DRAFT_679190 [Mycena pura]|uniref:Uncharacterized protein n=1 Tax=Mycena pura TaxID=153505 RepID=A0AAD6UX06_9AGAR|nr:hypothetical protein GGX14DRAFT_679190 [Mycena pura]
MWNIIQVNASTPSQTSILFGGLPGKETVGPTNALGLEGAVYVLAFHGLGYIRLTDVGSTGNGPGSWKVAAAARPAHGYRTQARVLTTHSRAAGSRGPSAQSAAAHHTTHGASRGRVRTARRAHAASRSAGGGVTICVVGEQPAASGRQPAQREAASRTRAVGGGCQAPDACGGKRATSGKRRPANGKFSLTDPELKPGTWPLLEHFTARLPKQCTPKYRQITSINESRFENMPNDRDMHSQRAGRRGRHWSELYGLNDRTVAPESVDVTMGIPNRALTVAVMLVGGWKGGWEGEEREGRGRRALAQRVVSPCHGDTLVPSHCRQCRSQTLVFGSVVYWLLINHVASRGVQRKTKNTKKTLIVGEPHSVGTHLRLGGKHRYRGGVFQSHCEVLTVRAHINLIEVKIMAFRRPGPYGTRPVGVF